MLSEDGLSIEREHESINKYMHMIPFDSKHLSYLEELIYEEYDSPISVSMLTHASPMTLLIYNRCINLSFKYYEFRDLRIYSLIGNKCYEKAKEKKPFDDIKPSDITLLFLNRLLNTLEYTYHMSKRDLIH